jgi:hypothetical protein
MSLEGKRATRASQLNPGIRQGTNMLKTEMGAGVSASPHSRRAIRFHAPCGAVPSCSGVAASHPGRSPSLISGPSWGPEAPTSALRRRLPVSTSSGASPSLPAVGPRRFPMPFTPAFVPEFSTFRFRPAPLPGTNGKSHLWPSRASAKYASKPVHNEDNGDRCVIDRRGRALSGHSHQSGAKRIA